MNNFCWYCGNKIKNTQEKCSNCNAEILEKRVDVKKRKELNNKQRKNENTLFLITISLPLIGVLCSIIELEILIPILFIINLICLVNLRIKYFYSTKVKILTCLYCLALLIFIIFIIWICVECGIIHPGY